MQEYMSIFPQPADEVNRAQVIKKKGLAELDRPIAALDDVLRSCVVTDLFGKELVCIFVSCILDDRHIMLAIMMKDIVESGEWLDTQQTGNHLQKPSARRVSS